MENFKRSNKQSILCMCNKSKITATDKNYNGLFVLDIEKENIVLQIAEIDQDNVLIEYLPREALEETTPNLKPDIDFQNYLETYINRDPFGGKYSGKMIKEVFEAGDKRWLDTALKEMKNEFIRERLQYIIDRGGYGKINS